jgi:hypothetical protein
VEGEVIWNAVKYNTEPADVTVGVYAMRLSNELGSWRCASTPALAPQAMDLDVPDRSECSGMGAYAGQVAILAVDRSVLPMTFEVLIVTGQLPPVPAIASR